MNIMRDLTLFNLGGMKYGIWQDEFRDVRDVQAIHWLPPVPKHIAGMSILDGRTVTLFDLPACIGLSPLTRKGKKYPVLLYEHENRISGFVVDSVIGHFPISPESILPMPDYMRTAMIDTCAMYASESIPVINMSRLYKSVLQADFEPLPAEHSISGIQKEDTTSVKTIRVFESGGESFAVPGACIEKTPVEPGRVSKMALLPPHVGGITFHQGNIIPLIRLSSRMKLSEKGTLELMLAADISGHGFGLLVDSDRGQWDDKKFIVKTLPPLAQSDWLQSAVVHDKEIIPLIEPGMLLSSPLDDADEDALPPKYMTDSLFKSQFGREDVNITEFSILGVRHAIPEFEVEDNFRIKPFRQLPNVLPIVAGILEHDGELLPVLDLAMCFGRRSPVTPEWRMILVKNGDFKALILTEAVFDEQMLSVEMQHELPFDEPYTLVYGCYTDEAVVRLILNVEALSVHFDTARFRELFIALSREMEQTLGEIAPAFPEFKDVDEIPEEIERELEPEESVELAAYVAAGEAEEEQEIPPEPEEPVYEEAAEPVTEPEPEAPPVEVAEEIERELESEEAEAEEPVEPIESVEVSEKIERELEPEQEAVEAVEEDIEQVEPVEPEEAMEPVELVEPTEPFDPFEPAKPFETVEIPAFAAPEEAEEEQEIPLEPEELIQEEAAEPVAEPEPEAPPVEVAEEIERELEPEESVKLAAYVAAGEAEKDQEIPVEPEESVYEEAAEPVTEPEPEAPPVEVAEEIERELEPEQEAVEPVEEDIEQVEPVEPEEAMEPVELVEPTEPAEPFDPFEPAEPFGTVEIPAFAAPEEAEEEQEIPLEPEELIQEEAAEPVAEPELEAPPAELPEEIERELEPEEIYIPEKPKRSPVYAALIALLLVLFLIPVLYFYGAFENWMGGKETVRLEAPVVVKKPVHVPAKAPKTHTPRKSPAIVPAPKKVEAKKEIPEKPVVAEKQKPTTAKPLKPLIPMEEAIKPVEQVVTVKPVKPAEPAEPVEPKKSPAIVPAPKKVEAKKEIPEKPVVAEKQKPASQKPSKQPAQKKLPVISSDLVIYNIKKGDTLYEITEKYTDYGFDYPFVAKENKIKNPDLIFPEQKLKIKERYR